MAALVQSKASAEVINATTVAATFDSSVTAGNLIVGVCAGWKAGGTTLSGIADNKGNGAYTVQENDLWDSEVRHGQGYKANVATGGTTFTVTATFATSVNGTLGILEYSGIETTPTVSSASNSGTGTAVTAGTVNPAAASTIVAGMIYNTGGPVTIAENHASYTQRLEIDENNDAQAQNIADRNATTGSQACTWSASGSVAWGAHSVAYSETSTGATLAAGAQALALGLAATLVAGAITLAAGAQVLGLSAPTASVSSGAVTLAAGSQAIGLSAPDTTLTVTISLAAGSQTLSLVVPAPAVSSGATTIAADANTLALSVDATVAATISLAGGEQTLALTAPSAAISSGASTVAAGSQILALSAPDVALSLGAVTLSAGGQILALINPDATVSAAGGAQTLTASVQTLALSVQDATVSTGAVTVQAGSQTLALVNPDATLAAPVTLSAGGQTLALSSPDVTLSAGAVTLSADGQVLGLSSPGAAVSIGASALTVGAQVLALIAPDATVVSASNQTLTADAAALALSAPEAAVTAVSARQEAALPEPIWGAAVQLPPTYTVIGLDLRPAVDVDGEIDISISVVVAGQCTVVREADIAGVIAIAVPFISGNGGVSAVAVARGSAFVPSRVDVVGRIASVSDARVSMQCSQELDTSIAGHGHIELTQVHLLKEARDEARRAAEETILVFGSWSRRS